jgi:RNA polymerase sigma-70 factor (ECF subfamily)
MPANPPLEERTAARLRADLVAFLLRRTRNAVLAEDLAQQAFLQLLAGLPRFRGAAALRTWARRIAANVWRDHLRREAVRPGARAARNDPFSVTALLDALGPRAPAPPAEEALDQEATHHCLLDAVRQLPLDARRIVLLHDFGDMPLDQAAATLGCSPGAAKVRLHRARRRLAERCRADCRSDTGPDGTVLCTPTPGPLRSPNPPARKRPTRGRS